MMKYTSKCSVFKLSVICFYITTFAMAQADETEKEWKVLANPQDLSVEDAAIMFLKKAPEPSRAEEKKELQRVKDLVSQARELIKPSDLLALKKVRSIQISSLGVFKYPFFNCRFKNTERGVCFEKTSGSQRKSGLVFQDDDRSLVILAASTVNNEPQRQYSGLTQSKITTHDDAGLIIKRGKTYLAIFPGKHNSFEIYEFR